MTDEENPECRWCGTTRSETWIRGFELRRHLTYCSNNCRFADDAPCYGFFVIILISLIVAFFIPQFAVFLEEMGSFATVQVTLSILTVAFVLLFIKGFYVRKNLPRGSRASE
jgi:uncharacterized membrane protein YqaE (UPF0057 family)